MLAHEMGHILVGKSVVPTWAFADQLIFPDEESLQRFSFSASEDDEEAASQKAIELLKNSPYKDKLASPGLFLRQIDAESKQLTNLISPHLRNSAFFDSELEKSAPALQPAALDQIAALPLGSRLKVDPWSDRVELLKYKPVELKSLSEKLPLGLTPFYPYITRKTGTISAATSAK
jgi:hypothetical protein